MLPFYSPYQIQQSLPMWLNQMNMLQTIAPPTDRPAFQDPSFNPNFKTPRYDAMMSKDPKTISDLELIDILDDHTTELKRLNEIEQQQQLPFLMETISVLLHVQKKILASVSQNDFFSLLRNPFIDLLGQWRRQSSLSDRQASILRKMAKLIKKLVRAAPDIHQLPRWLSDATLLDTVAECLADIASTDKLLHQTSNRDLRYFSRLIDAYIHYQQRLDDEGDSPSSETLATLLEPIRLCLTCKHFVHLFASLQPDQSTMTAAHKLLLLKCPAFLTSYNGPRLESSMSSLLTAMLPQYAFLLGRFVSSASQWKRPMLRVILHLLTLIAHGSSRPSSTTAQLVSRHLPVIDHVLRLVDEPTLYQSLGPSTSASSLSALVMETAVEFLVDMIGEPSILAHVKQRQATRAFLRLTTCEYEPVVLNAYSLLAYTTHEDDIKAMKDPGRLLSVIIGSLQNAVSRTPTNTTNIEQLLKTLKGLVQHDQLKDAALRQNILPFFLYCTEKLKDRTLILVFEILWSLTFCQQGALALRSSPAFLNKIQAIAAENQDEALKKAADGLVWKLVREPAFLDKVAKQAATDARNQGFQVGEPQMETVTRVVTDERGQQQVVTTTQPAASNANAERIFQYDMMISYCHADKELTYKIHKFLLAQGFKIWIDLDNMYGPAMNAMADAVENSEFVIMCMSDSYKQSTYCQAEAEYAFNCKRRLLPLIVRQGYKPDGWLGFMIGSRIYVDFGRFDFDTACEKLMNEINLQRKRPLPSKTDKIDQHEKPTAPVAPREVKPVSDREKSTMDRPNTVLAFYTRRQGSSHFETKPLEQWLESDVLDFLLKQRLIQLMPLCETMDGRALIQLYKMCIDRSSRAYMLLSDELQSGYKVKLPIGIYIRFLSAMEQRLATSSSVRQQPEPVEPKPPSVPVIPAPAPSNVVMRPKPMVSNLRTTQTRRTVFSHVEMRYPPPFGGVYDVEITSNASALDVLRAVERFGLNFQKMNVIPSRHSAYI